MGYVDLVSRHRWLLMAALPLILGAADCAVPLGLQDDDVSGDDDDDDNDDDISPWGEVDVDSVSPNHGEVEGGATVEIRGENLDGSGLDVRFGDEPALIVSIDDDRLQVTTPGAAGPGSVDVTVTTDDGADGLSGGFLYEWSGEDEDGGRIFLFHMEEPAFGTRLANALGRLYVPDDWGFLDHLPANGSCGYNVASPTVLYDYLDAGPQISFGTAQGSIVLTQTSDETGGPIYEEPNLSVATVQFDGTYSLDLPGGDGLPEMSIPQAILAGSDFSVFDPDLSSQLLTYWHRDPGATLQWSQGGDAGSRMLIQLISIDEMGTPTGGNLTCTSNDGGGMVFGPVELAYLQNGYNALYVSRYDITDWQNPYNGSDGKGVFVVTKVGTVFLIN